MEVHLTAEGRKRHFTLISALVTEQYEGCGTTLMPLWLSSCHRGRRDGAHCQRHAECGNNHAHFCKLERCF